MPTPKRFRIVTSAQVERTYLVEGRDAEQAGARLRIHLKDPEMLREGLVEPLPDETKNTTPEKIRQAAELSPVKEAPAPAAAGGIRKSA